MGGGDGLNHFVRLRGYEQVQVVAIVDKELRGLKSIDGMPLVLPRELFFINYDYIVVTVVNEWVYKEIILEALKMGINREKILPLRIFEIPFFDFNAYIEIKKSNISLLTDYCYGGFLYHKFGFQFTSPTINMFADNENYLFFLRNLDKCLNSKMIVSDVDVLENSFKDWYCIPRGNIGGCEWNFNHSITAQSAVDEWNRRVERFNRDHFIAFMVIFSDEAAYQFDSIPIKYKIGFYWKEMSLDSVICLPGWKSPVTRAIPPLLYCFADYVNWTVLERDGVRAINWMNVLLHKDPFLRVS